MLRILKMESLVTCFALHYTYGHQQLPEFSYENNEPAFFILVL